MCKSILIRSEWLVCACQQLNSSQKFAISCTCIQNFCHANLLYRLAAAGLAPNQGSGVRQVDTKLWAGLRIRFEIDLIGPSRKQTRFRIRPDENNLHCFECSVGQMNNKNIHTIDRSRVMTTFMCTKYFVHIKMFTILDFGLYFFLWTSGGIQEHKTYLFFLRPVTLEAFSACRNNGCLRTPWPVSSLVINALAPLFPRQYSRGWLPGPATHKPVAANSTARLAWRSRTKQVYGTVRLEIWKGRERGGW